MIGLVSAAPPTNSFFLPDDGLGSWSPGAAAICINQNRPSASERLICKGERVDSSGAKTSAPLPTGRRGAQNDTEGENTEKEESICVSRTQWAVVEGPSGRKEGNVDRLSVALRRGRRRGGKEALEGRGGKLLAEAWLRHAGNNF